MNSDENDTRIAQYEMRQGSLLARIVRRLTKWAWRRQLGSVTSRMYERGLIDSYVLHESIAFANKLQK